MRPNATSAGVVVGAYGWPGLVALQLAVLAETCPHTPVLVVGDDRRHDDAMAAVCASRGAEYRRTADVRLGHTGGDLAVYWHGLRWASGRGLSHMVKLSQRFIPLRVGWLVEGVAELVASGLPMACRRCDGSRSYPLRTEVAILDVERWVGCREVMDALAPRPRTPSPSAEAIIHRLLEDYLGGVYWPWSFLSVTREESREDCIWHWADGTERYRDLAHRYRVDLGADFHAGGWAREHAAGEYVP